MIFDKINNALELIEEAKAQLNELNRVEQEARLTLNRAYEALLFLKKPNNRFKLNALMVRKINALVAVTGEREDAINQIADEFGVSAEVVDWIYSHANKSKRALHRYALHFTAIKMKAAGFSAEDIARTIGVSPKYVYKLLVANIPLEL